MTGVEIDGLPLSTMIAAPLPVLFSVRKFVPAAVRL